MIIKGSVALVLDRILRAVNQACVCSRGEDIEALRSRSAVVQLERQLARVELVAGVPREVGDIWS